MPTTLSKAPLHAPATGATHQTTATPHVTESKEAKKPKESNSSSSPASAAAVHSVMGPPPPKEEKSSWWQRWRSDAGLVRSLCWDLEGFSFEKTAGAVPRLRTNMGDVRNKREASLVEQQSGCAATLSIRPAMTGIASPKRLPATVSARSEAENVKQEMIHNLICLLLLKGISMSIDFASRCLDIYQRLDENREIHHFPLLLSNLACCSFLKP
ncbi:hypothetical protein Q7P37_001263 [Cladosporium fusiforme]